VSALLGEIGTIEWCRRTNGILGRGEKARYMAAVALETARVLPRMLASRGGQALKTSPWQARDRAAVG
jgi:hypothetical protein